MKNTLFAGMIVAATCAVAAPAMAGDPDDCLECHEPAEDWQGMSAAEILADAKAPGNKRHKDLAALTDEQLQEIIAKLMPK